MQRDAAEKEDGSNKRRRVNVNGPQPQATWLDSALQFVGLARAPARRQWALDDPRLLTFLADNGWRRSGPPATLLDSSTEVRMTLLNRDDALVEVFKAFRAQTVEQGRTAVKPALIACVGGPGAGKTRFLFEVCAAALVPATWARTVQGFDAAIQHTFVRHMDGCVAVGITFNSLLMNKVKDAAFETNALGSVLARIFFSVFVDHNKLPWEDFAALVESTPINRLKFLAYVRAAAGWKPGCPIVLAVDEVRQHVEFVSGSKDVTSDLLKKSLADLLGVITSFYPDNVFAIISTLNAAMPENWQTESGRLVRRIPLVPLTEDNVLALGTRRFTSPQTHRKYEQALADTAGSPRLVQNVIGIARDLPTDTHGTENFGTLLLASLSEVSTVWKFRAQMGSPELLRGLVASILGGQRRIMDFDTCISMGFLLMQDDTGADTFEPTFPPLLMWWLSNDKAVTQHESSDSVAVCLLKYAGWFLNKDFSDSPGKAFETQFYLLLLMKVLAHYSNVTHADVLPSHETIAWTLAGLFSLGRTPQGTPEGHTFFNAVRSFPALLPFVEVPANEPLPTIDRPQVTYPQRENNEGLDLVLSFRVARNDHVHVLIIQLKWSYGSTSAGIADVAASIVNTVAHHPSLHEPIRRGRAGMLFAAYRNVTGDLRAEPETFLAALNDAVNKVCTTLATVTKKKSESQKAFRTRQQQAKRAEDARPLALLLASRTVVMPTVAIRNFLTPTFVSRPAFRTNHGAV